MNRAVQLLNEKIVLTKTLCQSDCLLCYVTLRCLSGVWVKCVWCV